MGVGGDGGGKNDGHNKGRRGDGGMRANVEVIVMGNGGVGLDTWQGCWRLWDGVGVRRGGSGTGEGRGGESGATVAPWYPDISAWTSA